MTFRRMRGPIPALACASAFWLMACGESVGVDGETSLQVLLTDAAADYIDSAFVDIGAVELVGGEGGPIALSDDGTDGPVNLLELQDAATLLLADETIPSGAYSQLRLQVDSARVVLAEGYEFVDGETARTLQVPSGAQSGIKLNLAAASEDGVGGPVEISPGQSILVLDFDVSQSFVIQGNPETDAGIHGVLFKPLIRVAVDELSGTISGTVATELTEVSLEGLTVTAGPVDEGILEEYQTVTASALTGADGSYTIHFVVPGTYSVSIEAPDGSAADPTEIEVEVSEGANVEDVDFTLVAGS